MSVINPEQWKLGMSRQWGASSKVLPSKVGILVATHPEIQRNYWLLSYQDLESPLFHEAVKELPPDTFTIVAIPPEPIEEVYRTRLNPMDKALVDEGMKAIIPTAPSPFYSLPLPIYCFFTEDKIFRVDRKDCDKLFGKVGKMGNLRGYAPTSMDINTSIKDDDGKPSGWTQGICHNCKFSMSFCEHIVSPLAVNK